MPFSNGSASGLNSAVASVSVATTGTITLSAGQAENGVIHLTGAPTGNVVLQFPAIGTWAIDATAVQASSHSVIAQTSAGNAVAVAPQSVALLTANGTNVLLPGGAPKRPSELLHWRAAVARVRSGTGRGRLLILGDSTSMGQGSGSGGSGDCNGAFPTAWPQALAGFANTFVPFSTKSFISNQVTPAATYNTYDSRVTMGTGWTNSVYTCGGLMFEFSGGTAGTLGFTPAGSIDTFTVYYVQQASQGEFTVNVDGGSSLGTVNAAGSNLLASQTFTVAAGTHTINLVSLANGLFYVAGIVAYLSTTPAIDFIQCGYSGAQASAFVGTSLVWSPQNAIVAFAPDLTVIMLTINDSNAGTALATYQSNLQATITSAQASGDVILASGVPSNTTPATNGTLDTYIQVVYSLAAANGCAVFDLKKRWGSYAIVNPVMPYYDNLHPKTLGYQDVAAGFYQMLAAA